MRREEGRRTVVAGEGSEAAHFLCPAVTWARPEGSDLTQSERQSVSSGLTLLILTVRRYQVTRQADIMLIALCLCWCC